MRKLYFAFCFFLFIVLSLSLSAGKDIIRIVVLGSSTAAGTGPINSEKAWVNQYRKYVQTFNASNEVINLAVGGYTTYHVLPNGYSTADTLHNITKALSYDPDAIIINLPTNDAANGYSVNQQLYNYSIVLAAAAAKNVPVWVTTTQPRYLSVELRQNLMNMRDSTYKYMGDKAIDFWTDIATDNGYIKSIYDMGDGTHLNDSAHTVLANRVIAKTEILSNTRSDNDIDTVNIDFGSSLSTGNWNNMNNATGDTINNLINAQGQKTGYSICINDAFTGINTAGTTLPSETLIFPSTATSDSFFGSVGAHSGIIEPTGGFALSGLSTSKSYTFTFFSSRTGVTDDRETMYIVSGNTIDTVYLDAANNVSNVATVSSMIPSEDGTITISVGPGPNNSNSSKYYFIGAISIVSRKLSLDYDKNGVINIDFGTNLSTGNWNNLTNATGGEIISDLINTEGNSTGYSIYVSDAFTGVNTTGTTTPDASLNLPSTVTSDSFFGSTGAHAGWIEATGAVTLGGLSADSKYSLSIFASRGTCSDNREAQYIVTGNTIDTVYLDAANNNSNMVTVTDMIPASNGTITIVASPGPNNTNSIHYYYLGALRIEYGSIETSLNNIKKDLSGKIETSLYPNPFKDAVTFNCSLPEAGELCIRIYNIYGQLEKELVSNCPSDGKYSITWDGVNGRGLKVGQGAYICRLSLNMSGKVYTCSAKLLVE